MTPDGKPEVVVGNPIQVAPQEELSAKSMEAKSALCTRLRKVLNVLTDVDIRAEAPCLGSDSHLLFSYLRPVISTCVVYVVRLVLTLPWDVCKEKLVSVRTTLLMQALEKEDDSYTCYGPPNDYFHPKVMTTLLEQHDYVCVTVKPRDYLTIGSDSHKNTFLIYGQFNMGWEPYRKYTRWGSDNDIQIKWDIAKCKSTAWYGFERDWEAPDGIERLHVGLVTKSKFFCNNLRYKDGEDMQYTHFDIPFEKMFKLCKSKDKNKVHYYSDAEHRCMYFTKITRVIRIMSKGEYEVYKLEEDRKDKEEYDREQKGGKKPSKRAEKKEKKRLDRERVRKLGSNIGGGIAQKNREKKQ